MLVRRTRLAPARAAARDPARGRKRWVDFGWTANFGREDIGGSAALSRQLRDNPRIGSSPRSFQSTHERSLSAESLQQHARIHGRPHYDRQLSQPFHDRARPRNRKSLRLASLPRRAFGGERGCWMLCGDCPNFAESSEQNGTVPLSRLGARGGEPACSMLGTGCSITSGPLVQCSNFGTHSTQWGSMVQNSEFWHW